MFRMDDEDRELNRQIGAAFSAERKLEERSIRVQLSIVSLKGRRSFVIVLVLAAAVGSAVLAYESVPDSFLQSLWLELTAGFGTFVAVPILLRLARRRQHVVVVSSLTVAGLCVVLGGALMGVTRSLMLAIGVALALAVALELFIARMLASLADSEARAAADLVKIHSSIDEARRQSEHAHSILDYKYALNDLFGLPRPDQMGGIGPILNDEKE